MSTIEKKKRRAANAGFTLVELMVVIAIIAILATIVGVNIFRNIDEANQKSAVAQITNFKTAIVSFKLKEKRLPQSLDELKPYMESPEIPKDPWNNDYHYELGAGTNGFTITSYGADGRAGGDEYNADISTENLSNFK